MQDALQEPHAFLCMQDISHRLWAFTKKLDKSHPDASAAQYDFEFTFKARLTKSDPQAPFVRAALGTLPRPVAPGDVVVEAPPTCSSHKQLALVLERAFSGKKLHSQEVGQTVSVLCNVSVLCARASNILSAPIVQ
jgi:hypothetical protein